MVERLANSEANSRRIAMVENAFGSGVSLQRPGRVLVGEGVLTKLCRKKPKPRQFFLFNDVLVYGNIVINKKKYNKEHILALENVQLVSLEDDGELRHGWQIISPSKSFSVYAATATEKAEWMAHINKCVTDLLKKTGRTGPGVEGAAVWVPDRVATSCMVCQKAKFTALNRRHHCRKCGVLVCGNCSRNKWLLPQINAKPVRICNNCYAALRSGADPNELGQVGKGTTAPPPTMNREVLRPRESFDEEPSQNKEKKEPLEPLPPLPPKQSGGKPNRSAPSPPDVSGQGDESSDEEHPAIPSSVLPGSVASKFGSSDEEEDDDEPLEYEQEEGATFFMDGGSEQGNKG